VRRAQKACYVVGWIPVIVQWPSQCVGAPATRRRRPIGSAKRETHAWPGGPKFNHAQSPLPSSSSPSSSFRAFIITTKLRGQARVSWCSGRPPSLFLAAQIIPDRETTQLRGGLLFVVINGRKNVDQGLRVRVSHLLHLLTELNKILLLHLFRLPLMRRCQTELGSDTVVSSASTRPESATTLRWDSSRDSKNLPTDDKVISTDGCRGVDIVLGEWNQCLLYPLCISVYSSLCSSPSKNSHCSSHQSSMKSRNLSSVSLSTCRTVTASQHAPCGVLFG
jgi:hypothetical protein